MGGQWMKPRKPDRAGLPLTSIDQAAVEALADALAEKIAARLPLQEVEDGWMTSAQAADYLAVPISTLRKLTAAGLIPFAQDVAGGRCYFKRSELDRWRARGATESPSTAEAQRGKNSPRNRQKSGPATLERPGPRPKEVLAP